MEQPSPYNVSTITCNATLNSTVNLQMFFDNVNISEVGFLWVEIVNKKSASRLTRGVYPKKKKNDANKHSFDNQVTMYYKISEGYCPNVKLFKNGNIQMTGIKKVADGLSLITDIATEVCRIAKGPAKEIVSDIEKVIASDFLIRMINSDFGMPFKIRRKSLHQLLISDTYNNACSFQPLTYPGVKLQYFWNKTNNTTENGICRCNCPCYGKGNGLGNGNCKKVTVSIFDSGKILVTGANSFEQVDDAYEYICKVIMDNKEELKKTITPVKTNE
jgi:TATA-box binding protein (TBP) (component of TFIID and TFIIIB)